jgi:orotidine-5'-phosphate decarboxylase
MTSERESLCVALDGSDRGWLLDTARSLAGEVGWLKVGLEAFVAHGPRLVQEISQLGCRVFLDLKLHDIPTTVQRALANCAAAGADMVTVHASGGRAMMEAAVAGASQSRSGSPTRVIAVTLLTSLDAASLSELGIATDTETTTVRWAALARACGVEGVVASAREAAAIRSRCGPDLLIVTPGIRPAWYGDDDDQERVVTPVEAVRRGADLLVVGRPVTRASEPVEAARRILREMAGSEERPIL